MKLNCVLSSMIEGSFWPVQSLSSGLKQNTAILKLINVSSSFSKVSEQFLWWGWAERWTVIWMRKRLKDPRLYRSSCPSAHLGQCKGQEEVRIIPSSILLNSRESPSSVLGFLWEGGDKRRKKANLRGKNGEREKNESGTLSWGEWFRRVNIPLC